MNKRDYSYLVAKGFYISEKKTSDFFDDFYDVLVSPNYELIFCRSRSSSSISIRKAGDKGEGYDFALVRALILKECCLVKQISIESLELFLKENFEQVESLFANENYKATKESLVSLELARARQMFPGAYDV